MVKNPKVKGYKTRLMFEKHKNVEKTKGSYRPRALRTLLVEKEVQTLLREFSR